MLKNGRRRCRRLWGTVKEKNQNTLTAMNSTLGIRVCKDFRVQFNSNFSFFMKIIHSLPVLELTSLYRLVQQTKPASRLLINEY